MSVLLTTISWDVDNTFQHFGHLTIVLIIWTSKLMAQMKPFLQLIFQLNLSQNKFLLTIIAVFSFNILHPFFMAIVKLKIVE